MYSFQSYQDLGSNYLMLFITLNASDGSANGIQYTSNLQCTFYSLVLISKKKVDSFMKCYFLIHIFNILYHE